MTLFIFSQLGQQVFVDLQKYLHIFSGRFTKESPDA